MPIYIGKQPLSLFKMRLPWEEICYKIVINCFYGAL